MTCRQESVGTQKRPGRKKRIGRLEKVGIEDRQTREDRSQAGEERWTEDRQAGGRQAGRPGQAGTDRADNRRE